MDITIPARQLRDAQDARYKHKGTLEDVTSAEPKQRCTFGTGALPSTAQKPPPPRREKVHTTLVRDMRPLTSVALKVLVPYKMEKFWSRGASGSELIQQLATSSVGGLGAEASATKG